MSTPAVAALVSVLAALAAAPVASALEAELEARYQIGLKLTTSVELPDSYNRDGSIRSEARILSIGFSQRDMLESLIEEGAIPGPLKGWKIVARSTSSSAEDLDYRLFAVKKGETPYALDEEGEGSDPDFDLGTLVLGYRLRFAGDTVSGSGKALVNFQGALDADGHLFQLAGVGTLPFAYKSVTLGDVTEQVIVPGKISLKVLGGATITGTEFGDLPVIIEGSLGFRDHKIVGVTEESVP